MSYGAFGDYHVIDQREAIPLPSLQKEFISLLVSGLTAGISLEKTGEMKAGRIFCYHEHSILNGRKYVCCFTISLVPFQVCFESSSHCLQLTMVFILKVEMERNINHFYQLWTINWDKCSLVNMIRSRQRLCVLFCYLVITR